MLDPGLLNPCKLRLCPMELKQRFRGPETKRMNMMDVDTTPCDFPELLNSPDQQFARRKSEIEFLRRASFGLDGFRSSEESHGLLTTPFMCMRAC